MLFYCKLKFSFRFCATATEYWVNLKNAEESDRTFLLIRISVFCFVCIRQPLQALSVLSSLGDLCRLGELNLICLRYLESRLRLFAFCPTISVPLQGCNRILPLILNRLHRLRFPRYGNTVCPSPSLWLSPLPLNCCQRRFSWLTLLVQHWRQHR